VLYAVLTLLHELSDEDLQLVATEIKYQQTHSHPPPEHDHSHSPQSRDGAADSGSR
jgi:hypothetical protein